MNFPHPIPVREIADMIQAEIIGDAGVLATGINEIHNVRPGDITFVDVKKYFDKSLTSAASIVLLNERVEAPEGKTLLLCEKPFDAYNRIVLQFRPYEPLIQAIHPTAQIHPSAIIEPNVVIGPHVVIGKDCRIHANTTILEHTILGDRVAIHSGTVIGTEAFYYKRTPEGYTKWRSGGRVVIEDDVEIGSCCTINKGVSADTIIGAGTKFDCHIHIGHDVVIGKRCLFAAQTGVGGNTVIGDDVVLYGQVGIIQNLKIGNKVVVLAQSGVNKDVEDGKVLFGSPAAEARTAYKELAAVKQLPDLIVKKKL
ncbi:MAG: UDP-3-O-(3-hydroxymyristoyl)glucosamine N-acyltransferase [Haliscomenobacter sp.]|nr:UDP-3-O-(3-hydroxymyristoyl)glucosamine N-acyltransferase [Haliscomenobacter sp.]